MKNEVILRSQIFKLIIVHLNIFCEIVLVIGDISILYNLNLTNNGTAVQLRFYESSGSGTNYTAIQAQTQAGDITYTLPAVAGTNEQILSTNGSGSLSWNTIATGWGLTGNTGTNDGTNYIGTTDNVALNFKVNG